MFAAIQVLHGLKNTWEPTHEDQAIIVTQSHMTPIFLASQDIAKMNHSITSKDNEKIKPLYFFWVATKLFSAVKLGIVCIGLGAPMLVYENIIKYNHWFNNKPCKWGFRYV